MQTPSPWRRQHIADPWRARWVRGNDTIVADWTGVTVDIGKRGGNRLLGFCSGRYQRMELESEALHLGEPDATCAALRDAWDMHRQLRSLRISATSTRLREIAALAEAGQ